jgi:hypothetical protein
MKKSFFPLFKKRKLRVEQGRAVAFSLGPDDPVS